MRIRSLLAISGAAVAAACASTSGGGTPDPSTTPVPAGGAAAGGTTGGTATTTPTPTPAPGETHGAGGGMMWQGTIRPESGTSVGGTVMLMPGAAAQTTATISLTGAPANGTHPWHVHSGTCAEKGPIVGTPSAYTPLKSDASGAAQLEATLPFAPPASGSYSVNVHMSPTQMGMIVGCADLRMGQ